jgi:hypothetical protein
MSIREYLQRKDPELLEALDEFSADENPVDKINITFIMPNKDFRNALIDMIRNNDQIGAEKYIKAMFVQGSIPRYEKFNGPPRVTFAGLYFPLESASTMSRTGGGQVRLKNGAVLTYLPDFQNTDTASIYQVVQGNLPTDGEQVGDQLNVKSSDVSGSREYVNYRNFNRRKQLHYHLIEKYANFVYKCCKGERECINPYTRCVLSLLAHLKLKYDNQGDSNNLYNVAVSMMGHGPIATFYILVQPMRTRGGYIISDEDINSFQIIDILKSPVDLWLDILRDYSAKFPGDITQIKNIKLKYFPKDEVMMKGTTAKRLLELSEKMNDQNSDVNRALRPFYPEMSWSIYMKNPHMKYWQDKVRLHIFSKFDGISRVPSWKTNISNASDIHMNVCRAWQHIAIRFPGEDYRSELEDGVVNIASDANAILRDYFINTGLFLYVPQMKDDAFLNRMDQVYRAESEAPDRSGGKVGYDMIQSLILTVSGNMALEADPARVTKMQGLLEQLKSM